MSWESDFLAYRFSGLVTIVMHEGLYIRPPAGTESRFEYTSQKRVWKMGISPRNLYYIQNTYLSEPIPGWWSVDPNSDREIFLHTGGCDDWENFLVEKHGDGFALKSLVTHEYVCAEPKSQPISLTANRPIKSTWERFIITPV